MSAEDFSKDSVLMPRDPKIDAFFDDTEAWEAAEDFERNRDRVIKDEWRNRFGRNPESFFGEENVRSLANVPIAKRLAFLAQATRHLTVRPSMVNAYFQKFPSDKHAVAALVVMSDGLADDGLMFSLFSAVWPSIGDVMDLRSLRGTKRNGGQYFDVAEAREIAPDFLLSNHREGEGRMSFGEGAEGFVEALQEADELKYRESGRLHTSGVFSSETYKALTDGDKAALLRRCLDELQFTMVFNEAFNAGTSRANIERDNEYVRQMYRRSPNQPPRAAGHSILYQSWQPASAYDISHDYVRHEMNSPYDSEPTDSYAYDRLTNAVLEEFKNIKQDVDVNTDLLVEFWLKNRDPLYAPAMADAIKSQNPNRAGELLLDALRKDTGNKSAIAYMLRRVDSKTLLKNIADVANLLKGEDTSERFLLDSFAILRKRGELSLEDVGGGEVMLIPGSELRGELRRLAQMEDILVKTDTEMYPKEFAAKLEHQFRGLHGNPGARFYTFEWQGKVASFMTFVDRPPQSVKGMLREVYFGFFRTSGEFKGGKIGEALLEVALDREMARLTSEGKPFYILAYCDPKAPITQKYFSLGFVPTRSFTTQDGVDRLEIRLEPDSYYAKREPSRS
ncbi:MAG: hypothetical protein WA021_00060 [Minisyncoccia bacterium]